MPRQTYFAKAGDVQPRWHHVDAEGQVLGRMATGIATVLMGKHRPEYTPHVDCGDFVVVTNAAKVVLTGKKAEQKMKLTFSGYPGGLKEVAAGEMLQKHPERIIEQSVRGMLPKGPLGRSQGKKLKVYPGSDHPHAAQQPERVAIPA